MPNSRASPKMFSLFLRARVASRVISSSVRRFLLPLYLPLALALPDEGPLEFGHGADDLQMQALEGRALPAEYKIFLVEFNSHVPVRHVFQYGQQVLQAACQAVDAVHMQHVPCPQGTQTGLEFRPVHVFATRLVHEDPVQRHPFQLPVRTLPAATDTNISNVHVRPVSKAVNLFDIYRLSWFSGMLSPPACLIGLYPAETVPQ